MSFVQRHRGKKMCGMYVITSQLKLEQYDLEEYSVLPFDITANGTSI